MSNLYNITAEIHQLIDQINQEKGLGLNISSHSIRNIISKHYPDKESEYLESLRIDNIQQLLIDLDLNENAEWKTEQRVHKESLQVLNENRTLSRQAEGHWRQARGRMNYMPETQAKALSEKWFSLQETDGKATPSLWNSGEDGQIQVLQELKTILENYLQN